MSELRQGQTVDLENGSRAKIISELGRGGQGIVYLVEMNNQKYALKWYLETPSEWFYRNIKSNAERRAPARNFLWAITVTKRIEGDFGYIMPLRPQGFKELGDFFCADRKTGRMKAVFKTFTAMLNAGINICNSFGRLHREGFSYQDVNEGGFFINPDTGDVLICDTDNVVANNSREGFEGGKPRYMAAEVVNGGHPNTESDLFSLAILLYRIFMIDHPLEGKYTAAFPCMDDNTERHLYGEGAIFTFDKDNDTNRPSHIHKNANYRWKFCPRSLQAMFQRALGHEAIIHPRSRVRDEEWKRLFVTLRRNLIVCPDRSHSEDIDFMVEPNSNSPVICPFCGREPATSCKLVFDGSHDEYILTRHKYLYLGEETTPFGYCRIRSVGGRVELGIENYSEETWVVTTPSGKVNPLLPKELMPLRDGMFIRFKQNYSAEVKIR